MYKDKPWVVIFNWADPLGRIYISEEDHAKMLQAINDGGEQVILNGQLINLKFSTIIKNPDYPADENEVIDYVGSDGKTFKVTRAQLRKAIAKQEAELLKRRDRKLFDE